jgi:formylglycine-generating enzyme required for sulfatase activity
MAQNLDCVKTHSQVYIRTSQKLNNYFYSVRIINFLVGVVIISLISGCTSSIEQSQSDSVDFAYPPSIVVSNDSSSLEVNSTDQIEMLNTDEPDFNSSVLPMATPDTPLNEEPGIYQERVREIDGAIEVLIPAGEFFFGCDPQHNGGFECLPDELPLEKQYLETFAIDKFEVTNVQYARCVAAGACEQPVYTYSATRESYYDNPAYADYPVSAISWDEAYAYCTWVGGRLPTEAEWEKAARGETMRAYPWGNEEPNCNLANSRDDRMGACVGDTAPVGSYPLGASPYGVMDMAGNVWEWVMDYYVHDYSGHLINLDPLTEGVVYKRIIKGGSFDYNSYTMRIAYNSDHTENERNISFGFRCMRPME